MIWQKDLFYTLKSLDLQYSAAEMYYNISISLGCFGCKITKEVCQQLAYLLIK